ncbi:MAG: spore cortex biosynthesis protein YabQ [Ruminococcus sp.]|nr:spore cortex biosynthesis protein YabQ [Ruminococcus sp.]
MNVPETFFSVNEELLLFGMSCIMGAVFGVIYDIFRIIRIIFAHNGILIALEDIVFLGIYGVSLIAFASAAARGELRFYFVIGNFIGFTLYFFTIGSIVSSAVRKLFFALKKVFSVVLYPIKKCCAFLCRKTGAKFVGSSKVVVNCFKKIRILLLKFPFMMYNKMESKKKERGKGGKKSKKKNEGSV